MKTFGRWTIACLAALAFFAPLKFGAPVVTQALMFVPGDALEWILEPWPNQIAFVFILVSLLWLVLDAERLTARVDFLFLLPLLFLLTQAAPTLGSINRQVSLDTLVYFACCVLLFYTAAWYVRDGANAAAIFGGLGLATMLVCVAALRQYFGGLEETRQFAAAYVDTTQAPKDFLLRLTSNRPFAWFGGYPNALAGFLVIAFAPTLAWISVRGRGWDPRVRRPTLALAGCLMGFCLILTGSRGGYVAFAVTIVTALLVVIPSGARRTLTIGAALCLLGVILFIAHRSGMVSTGTTSMSARTDYWRGAVSIARDHPWLGTGPGTFGSIYPKYKTAQTEEAQLVHNNYLQMWSDSGLAAFVVFGLMWVVAIKDSFKLIGQRRDDAAAIAICASLTGWVVHGFVDFDLYVPGVAFPAFILLGILQGLKELPAVTPVAERSRGHRLIGTLCVAVAGVVIWMEGTSVLATYRHDQAYAMLHTNPQGALDAARQAARLAPFNALYQSTAGDLAVRLRYFDDAAEHYRAAIDDDPYRASYHWRLARAEVAARGPDTAALQQLRLAVSLNPTSERYSQELAEAEESVRQSSGGLLQSSPAKE